MHRLQALIPRAVRRAGERLKLTFGAGLPLGDLSRVLAGAFGGRPAIESSALTPGLPERSSRTYADLEDDVARLTAVHRAARVSGAPVAILCGNRVDVLLHTLALARAGAAPLPLNHRLRPEEQAAAIAAAGALAIVADADLATPLLALPAARALRPIWTGAGGGAPGPGFRIAPWLDEHPQERVAEGAPRAPDGVALLLTTSGTTGVPKVAKLTSRNLLGAIGRVHALPVGWQWGLRAGRDVVLAALPLTHVMGLTTMLGALCAGIRILHMERFDASQVLARIEGDRPNVFVGVPTMYADLENAGAAQRDLSSIELWVSAADAMPPDRARRFQQYGTLGHALGRRVGTAAFTDVYGMVELGGAAAVRVYPPAPRARELPAIGFVLPGFSARVVGSDGKARRMGAAGELELSGAGVFAGYEGAGPPGTDGWFPTGDLARLGPAGTFALIGRKADRIKVGGFSVFPAEVEAELRGHRAVAELAVVGVRDERLGERPVALVVPRGAFDAEEFLAWAAGRVAPYRRPRAALAVESLPLGKNGKIDRRAAANLAERLLGVRPGAAAPARR